MKSRAIFFFYELSSWVSHLLGFLMCNLIIQCVHYTPVLIAHENFFFFNLYILSTKYCYFMLHCKSLKLFWNNLYYFKIYCVLPWLNLEMYIPINSYIWYRYRIILRFYLESQFKGYFDNYQKTNLQCYETLFGTSCFKNSKTNKNIFNYVYVKF